MTKLWIIDENASMVLKKLWPKGYPGYGGSAGNMGLPPKVCCAKGN